MCWWQVRCDWKQFFIHQLPGVHLSLLNLNVIPSGCTNVVPVATFWQNLVYRKKCRLSSDLQLYRHNKAFSPANITSSLENPGWLKTLACSRNSASVLIFANTRDSRACVESQNDEYEQHMCTMSRSASSSACYKQVNQQCI